MAWQDRDYAADSEGRRSGYHGAGMDTLSVTSILILVNIGMFFLTRSPTQLGAATWNLGFVQPEAVWHGQIWRLFTATYLHAGFAHILLNMLGLYFFGPALERVWGPRQYFFVYTIGGIAGNIVLTLAGLVGFIQPDVKGVGASGSILTLLGAAAVLFPTAQVYVYFILPISIRTFVLIYGAFFVLNILNRGANFGGDISHLVGLLIGFLWARTGGLSLSGRHRTRAEPSSLAGALESILRGKPTRGSGAWEERMRQRQADDATIDRLLAKVHQSGMQSLTEQERHELQAATLRRQAEERRIDQETRI